MKRKRIIYLVLLPIFVILGLMTIEGFIVWNMSKRHYVPSLENQINNLQEELSRAILTEPDFFYLGPEDGLMEALEYYDVKCPEIVYAQAVIESGGFKSALSVYHGNLFGLKYRSGGYMKFKHWSESVKAYRDLVQYKIKENEDYYRFLDRIGYAEDSLYTKKLKNLVNKK